MYTKKRPRTKRILRELMKDRPKCGWWSLNFDSSDGWGCSECPLRPIINGVVDRTRCHPELRRADAIEMFRKKYGEAELFKELL